MSDTIHSAAPPYDVNSAPCLKGQCNEIHSSGAPAPCLKGQCKKIATREDPETPDRYDKRNTNFLRNSGIFEKEIEIPREDHSMAIKKQFVEKTKVKKLEGPVLVTLKRQQHSIFELWFFA